VGAEPVLCAHLPYWVSILTPVDFFIAIVVIFVILLASMVS